MPWTPEEEEEESASALLAVYRLTSRKASLGNCVILSFKMQIKNTVVIHSEPTTPIHCFSGFPRKAVALFGSKCK
jgi:hypothetical protein